MITIVHALNSLLPVFTSVSHAIVATPTPTTCNTSSSGGDFSSIVTTIGNVKNDVLGVATAVGGLMVIIAGMMIMIDREASMEKRGQRLAFLKTVLIGYGIVLGASFLITTMGTVMANGGLCK